MFEKIKQFFHITSKQRQKGAVSLRCAIIAKLSGEKVALETHEESLSQKRATHKGILRSVVRIENCSISLDYFRIYIPNLKQKVVKYLHLFTH